MIMEQSSGSIWERIGKSLIYRTEKNNYINHRFTGAFPSDFLKQKAIKMNLMAFFQTWSYNL